MKKRGGRALNFVGEEEADGLHGLLAAVHIVAEEDVIGLGRKAAVPGQARVGGGVGGVP